MSSPIALGPSGQNLSSKELKELERLLAMLKADLSSDERKKVLSQFVDLSKDDRASSPIGSTGNWMSSQELRRITDSMPSSSPVGVSGNWITSHSSYSGTGITWLKVILVLGATIGGGWLIVHFLF